MTILLSVVAWLITYLMHSTILLGGAGLLATLGVVRSDQARDTLWKVALVGGLLTATVQLALRLEPVVGTARLTPSAEAELIDVAARGMAPSVFSPIGRGSREDARPAASAERLAGEVRQGAVGVTHRRVDPPLRRVLSGVNISWPGVVLQLWLFGALAFGLRLVLMRLCLTHQLASRRSLSDGPLVRMLDELRASAGVRRGVRLSVSEGIAGPIAIGRSEIVVPGRVLDGLAADQQRAVLAHELGHLVRRDPAWLVLGHVIECLFFMQPLNRVARRRLQDVAEYLCDDWAANRTGGGLALATCLAEVATWVRGRPQPAPVAAMAEDRSHLVARVQRLLGGPRSSARGPAVAWRAAVGAGALALVAWAAPGVAAGDATEQGIADASPKREEKAASFEKSEPVLVSSQDGDGWMSVRDGGRLLVLHRGFSVRLRGSGRIAFRQWGRAFAVPDGYTVQVNGDEVTEDLDVCERDGTVRILDENGATAWVLEPVPMSGAYSSASASPSASASASAFAEASDTGEVFRGGDADVDAAIDTLVSVWSQEPVNRAARRLARHAERIEPALDSLGELVSGRIAPQLESLGTDLARELVPALARLGTGLGRGIAAELADPSAFRPGRRTSKPKVP